MFCKMLITLLGFVLTLSYEASAINCHSCNNINQGACFNVSKTNPNRSEPLTCSVHSKELQYEMKRIYGPNFEHKTKPSTDIRCVHFEKYYFLTQSRESFRGCLQKKYAREFCDKQQANQDYYYYNLTSCHVCSSDLCNSGVEVSGGIGLVVAAFAVIFIKYIN